MTLRKFLGALCLGLPAAVLAHSLSFGSSHTLAGIAHELVFEATLAAACASMAALFFAAIYFATGRRSGSIVAARMAPFLPGMVSVSLAAGGWFWLFERAESAHGLSLGLVVAAIAAASFALRNLLVRFVHVLAAIAVAICSVQFQNRPAIVRLNLFGAPRPALCTVVVTRFSRPPPVFS